MLQLTIIQCERTERICLTITARLVKSFPVMDPSIRGSTVGQKCLFQNSLVEIKALCCRGDSQTCSLVLSHCGVTPVEMESEREKHFGQEEWSFVLMTQCYSVNGSVNAHLEANCWTCCPKCTDRMREWEIDRRQTELQRVSSPLVHTSLKSQKSGWRHKLILTSVKILASF